MTTLVVVVVATLGAAPVAAQPTPQPGDATFIIFLQSRDIGRERVSLRRNADGWLISSEGVQAPPLDVALRRFEAQYAPDWTPRSLVLDATARTGLLSLKTTFTGTSAVTTITTTAGTSTKTDAVAPDTIALPNNAFGAYEALGARLSVLAPGAEVRAYVIPQAEVVVRLTKVVQESIQTAARTFTARRHVVTVMNPAGPIDAEIWTDDRQRLLRVSIGVAALNVVRADIASVAARVQTFARAGDEDVRIQSTGFSLAGTISKPAATPPGQRLPAVILAPGSGPTDRDETVAGIPIFGQLAAALADAGFLVVRYDKRGVSQSGGRTEASTLSDYAEDVRAIVRFLTKRKDVDSKRVAVVGHSEGGLVGLLAASRDKKITALVLVATPATTGGELVLEQQRHLLDRMKLPEAEQQAKIELQKKIQAAVAAGKGWEGIPADVRRQADTPWFQSFLAFDPAKVMPKVRQPILIVQGDLDTQVAPLHAQRLVELSRGRKRGGAAKVITVPGVNHLLVQAETGEVDEYGSLKDKTLSAKVVEAIVSWLKTSRQW